MTDQSHDHAEPRDVRHGDCGCHGHKPDSFTVAAVLVFSFVGMGFIASDLRAVFENTGMTLLSVFGAILLMASAILIKLEEIRLAILNRA